MTVSYYTPANGDNEKTKDRINCAIFNLDGRESMLYEWLDGNEMKEYKQVIRPIGDGRINDKGDCMIRICFVLNTRLNKLK